MRILQSFAERFSRLEIVPFQKGKVEHIGNLDLRVKKHQDHVWVVASLGQLVRPGEILQSANGLEKPVNEASGRSQLAVTPEVRGQQK